MNSLANITEAENSERQAELKSILASELFARSSNSARFLSYVCEQYFAGSVDRITEYDIGISALGRRSDFDPRIDSVVRVEAHRVRKRLAQFYEEDPGHEIRIVIPSGHYVPQFVRTERPPVDVKAPQPATPEVEPVDTRSKRNWLAWVAAAVTVLLSALLLLRAGHKTTAAGTQPIARAVPSQVAASGSGEIRIRCGGDDAITRDSAGFVWGGDRYFRGGVARKFSFRPIERSSDPFLYTTVREGDEFSYDVPVKSGIYELRLYFADALEPLRGDTIIRNSYGENAHTMHVELNGEPLLPIPDGRHLGVFDVLAEVGGDAADIKVWKDITPASDGYLHLRFSGLKGRAFVNAIEIRPGKPGRLLPIRLAARESSYTDSSGAVWMPDQFYRGGRLSYFQQPVSDIKDSEIHQGERFGRFSYEIPVPPGRYSVTVHFTENFYTPESKAHRTFNLYSEGITLLSDFDVVKEAGARHALLKTFHGLKSTPQDKIALFFVPVKNYAIVNAIEVVDESK